MCVSSYRIYGISVGTVEVMQPHFFIDSGVLQCVLIWSDAASIVWHRMVAMERWNPNRVNYYYLSKFLNHREGELGRPEMVAVSICLLSW